MKQRHRAPHQCSKNSQPSSSIPQPQEQRLNSEGYGQQQLQKQEQSFIGNEPSVASEHDDEELEAAFQTLRLSSLEEALACLNQEPHPEDIASSSSGNSSSSGCSSKSSSSSSSSPPTSPTFSNSDSSTTLIAPKDRNESAATNDPSPKRARRVLSQLDVNELIQMKISQLESAPFIEEDEEKAIAKQMKKVHKEISQVSNGQEDQIAKVNLMQRKYLEMFQDMRKQERDHAKLKKKHELLQREKDLLAREKDRIQQTNDTLVVEHGNILEERRADKVAISKSDNLCRKLEGLCRQIHKENKHIKLDQHADQRPSAIVNPGTQEVDESQRHIIGNEALWQERLRGFMEQYDLREKHFNSIIKSKDLELQLAQAKMDRQKKASQEETAKMDQLKSQLQASAKTEAELRKQLSVYVEKFKQVEETLNKSNTLFQTFRKEMEAMAKKGGRLEKVNVAIRAKCDTMNRNILEMVEERAKQQSAFDDANKKLLQLEGLCRAFQAERTVLREEMEMHARHCMHNATPGVVAPQSGSVRTGEVQVDVGFRDASGTRAVMNGMGASFMASGTTPSLPNGVAFKQGIVGTTRRVPIPTTKFRQKPKRQRLQVGIQRSGGDQHHHSLTLTVSSRPGSESFVIGGDIGVIEEHHINLQNGFQCDILLPPPPATTSTTKNRAEQIFAGSAGMVKLSESIKKASAIAGTRTVIPTTSIPGAKAKTVNAKDNAKQTLEKESCEDTHSTCSHPISDSPTSSKGPTDCSHHSKIWPTPIKTPILSSMVSSTSLGAISRQAQAEDGYQTIRIPGLYPSAITIK
ncbi:MAG: myosin-like coiled-coil protein-domain-containing protein [Linnemannia gamsii]|nr:MAG: myosin-like coiled-coil protein-domain-containing protein [Linnemannia gamsii]